MTPDKLERFEAFEKQLASSPGFALEAAVRRVALLHAVFSANADELGDALAQFQGKNMLELMSVERQPDLERFLVHVTRRLYNHLATAVSCVDYIERIPDRRFPVASASEVRKLVQAFRATTRYRLNERLRDHAIHHELHLTTARIAFRKPSTVDGEILLNLEPVRRRALGRRMKRKKPAVTDPLAALTDRLEIASLLNDYRQDFGALVSRVQATLVSAGEPFAREVAWLRREMRNLWQGG